MITNRATIVPANVVARPKYLETMIDANYKSRVVRITGDVGTPLSVVGGVWQLDARHHYSKDQPWNDDMSMIWIEQKGSPGKIILDGATYAPLYSSDGADARSKMLRASHECRWRPMHPRQMVSWIKSSQELAVWDAITGAVVWRVKIASSDPGFGWISEGTISSDGRYTVLGTHFASPRTTGAKDYVVVVDLDAQRVGPLSDVSMFTSKYANSANGNLGNINISAKGGYVMGKLEGTPEYGFILKVDPVTLAATPQTMSPKALRMAETKADTSGFIACMSHADGNITPAGREVFVGGVRDYGGNTNVVINTKANGHIIAIDCETGEHAHIDAGAAQTGGLAIAGDQHTSGRCYRLPGWHLVTHASRIESSGQFCDEMVLWKLDGSRECIRFGTTHTDDSNYRAEAHGCPSPDGSRVMFASNWQKDVPPPPSSMGEVKSYVVSAISGIDPPPPPVDPQPRYYVSNTWTYQPSGAVVDRVTGKIVPLLELAAKMNKL